MPHYAAIFKVAFDFQGRYIWYNHARLASTDFGRNAHFGGFFFFGVHA
jgi:hypothetical protein